MKLHRVTHRVNHREVSNEVEPRMLLSDYIRHRVYLKGTRVGCEQGACGACTVLIDSRPVRSCLIFAVQTEGCDIETVEVLSTYANDSELHVLQESFKKCHGLQCGYCTSGFLMTLLGKYHELDELSEEDIRQTISGNLCRCTGYESIIDSVLEVNRRK